MVAVIVAVYLMVIYLMVAYLIESEDGWEEKPVSMCPEV